MFHNVWYHVHSSPVRHTAIEGSVDLIVPVFVGYLDHACAPPQSKIEPCWFQWFIPICISRCFSLVLPTICFRNGSSLFLYIPATVDGASFTGFHVLLFFWKATTPEANKSLCQLMVGRCIFLFKSRISRCYVSFREATPLPANIYQIALHLFVWLFPQMARLAVTLFPMLLWDQQTPVQLPCSIGGWSGDSAVIRLELVGSFLFGFILYI